jgi:hypothetical protein
MKSIPSWYVGPHAGLNNRPRKKRAKQNAPEHRFQASLVKVLRQHARRPWWAVPNGGYRHLHTAMKLKAEGARRGVSDLHFILEGGRLATLELKAAQGSLSEDQKTFRDESRAAGALWEYARTIDQAYGILVAWEVLPRGFALTEPTTSNQAA